MVLLTWTLKTALHTKEGSSYPWKSNTKMVKVILEANIEDGLLLQHQPTTDSTPLAMIDAHYLSPQLQTPLMT